MDDYESQIKIIYYKLKKEMFEIHSTFEYISNDDIDEIVNSNMYKKNKYILEELDKIISSIEYVHEMNNK